MSLETGRYTIKNGDNVVGRALAEDLSLLPKRIILAPSDRDSTWIIEKSKHNENEYLLISNGSPTTHIEDHIFALLVHQSQATKWTIKAVPKYGEDAYNIFATDSAKGWIAPKEIGDQILYHGLISTGLGQQPSTQVFQIVKVE
ncbi:serine protease inhibitor [Lentinula aff. detonsa]|uniref:Serine protease inhibitor n=1 Tax=Lentinula aff. detonsa TaxID=2804958 RepID=A0AA38NSN5_9AGAR|nr:serine protease inhibitor [Lentinula aff. detonsa]KAJ3798343.1 serine protease inhibitor [Lentinula aff. detonsa]